jgi:cell division protein FtsQ
MWDDVKQLHAVATGLALLAAALLGYGAVQWITRLPAFEFRAVTLDGALERVSAPHLEAVIRDELAGTFFTMNLDRARASLERVPWVRRIALRRQWPQRLEISVEEHVPLARWNATALVNVEGEVFAAEHDGELPQFEGPEGRSTEMAARYREWNEALAPLAMAVEALRLSARGGWYVRARGEGGTLGLELGRDEPAARLARFLAAHGQTLGVLARTGRRIEHVDLRYRNGFAARVPGFRERAPKRAG